MMFERCFLASLLATAMMGSATADPWADSVISFTPGTGGSTAFQQHGGTQALGEPSRTTGSGQWASQVGVYYPPYNVNQLVSIGAGGQLTVFFNEPVENDPLNPFGIDLLVFGNAFFVTSGGTFAEPGTIEVSQDNLTWHTIPSVFADDKFPTLGYTDTSYTGSGNVGGTILTDFTLPVDPSLDVAGMTEAEINAAYNGSGGGTGVDLDTVGLDWIQYVRVLGNATGTEIDAFADVAAVAAAVPEPATMGLVLLGMLAFGARRAFGKRA